MQAQNDSRAVITVIGKDTVGIIAKVTALLAKEGVNILDISQTIVGELFTMIMIVDLGPAKFDTLQTDLSALSRDLCMDIRFQHYGIFEAMHRI